MNRLLTKSYLAGGVINPYRIVKMGADDDHVIQGAAVADSLIGVIDQPLNATVAEDRVDVTLAGIADVVAGGAITRGDYVTTDATGQAVAAAPGAGVNNGIVGKALVSAAAGDIIPVLLNPGRIQG